MPPQLPEMAVLFFMPNSLAYSAALAKVLVRARTKSLAGHLMRVKLNR